MSDKKAALVLDTWKLPFFEKALKEAEFAYTVAGAFTEGTTAVTIPYTQEQFKRLESVLRAADAEARLSKAH